LEISEEEKTSNDTDLASVPAGEAGIIQELLTLSGTRILEKIFEQDNPQKWVRHIPQEDFFWLVKKVGEDDCSPLLKMASDDQRQYLLDLEFWEKDRLDLDKASEWLGRLHLADPQRLVKWFQSKGESMAYYYFFKGIQVEIRSEDEDQEFDESFFTFDDVFYVKILDEAHGETIKDILRTIAADDLERYQAFLSTLAGVIPVELEEDMYRLRNVRLAEHGFLPPEEALAAYAPLDPEALNVEEQAEPANILFDQDIHELIPISPLYHARGRNILTKAFSGISDNLLLDRIRLEFAGLCNQIMSADGVLANELDVLIRACRKAAGHLNLALESVCGTDTSWAEKILKNNHLEAVFRVGFGRVLALKWETQRWLKDSWFHGLGLDFSFWGDEWGETLAGILEDKPRLYTGFEEDDEYKAFEYISELDDCRILVRHLKALDRMLEQLTEVYPLDKEMIEENQLTFRQVLFNLWARHLLNLEPGYSGISADQVKVFFGYLRAGEEEPPYKMLGIAETFTRDFMAYAPDIGPELKTNLQDALTLIWQEFAEEYAWVAAKDLEGRYTKFLATDQEAHK